MKNVRQKNQKLITKAPQLNGPADAGIQRDRRKLENTKKGKGVYETLFFRAFVLSCFRDLIASLLLFCCLLFTAY